MQSLFGEVLVSLDSQGALCGLFLYFACCFLFRKEQHFGSLFFPHSMLGSKYWASSCLNRSTQVSWVEIWKPTGERGTCFHSKTFMIKGLFTNWYLKFQCHVAVVRCFPGWMRLFIMITYVLLCSWPRLPFPKRLALGLENEIFAYM